MSSSMKKATKMSVADFERVQSIPDWAVFSFDSYMKYVGHGTLSHSEFLEYHTDWLKLVVKLDTKIFGNRQSRSKSKSHAKNPFIEDEAVNYGADDCASSGWDEGVLRLCGVHEQAFQTNADGPDYTLAASPPI